MSLYTIEQKNIPVVKEWGYTPIQGFADGGSFGTTESGDGQACSRMDCLSLDSMS